MDKFKIKPISKNSSAFCHHHRRKSDQMYDRESYIHIKNQISTNRGQNMSNAVYRASLLIRNSSNRSHSNEIKQKVALDLSKIRHTKNSASMNFSARNSEYHKKFSQIYLRKKSSEIIKAKPLTDRNPKKENVCPLACLEPTPGIEALCTNRFIERLFGIENKLSHFYAKKLRGKI